MRVPEWSQVAVCIVHVGRVLLEKFIVHRMPTYEVVSLENNALVPHTRWGASKADPRSLCTGIHNTASFSLNFSAENVMSIQMEFIEQVPQVSTTLGSLFTYACAVACLAVRHVMMRPSSSSAVTADVIARTNSGSLLSAELLAHAAKAAACEVSSMSERSVTKSWHVLSS